MDCLYSGLERCLLLGFPWYWIWPLLLEPFHDIVLVEDGRKEKKVIGAFGKRTRNKDRCKRVEAYCEIKSDRHRPDCEAISSLTFDR